MIPRAYKEFIAKLLEATERGDLTWEEGDNNAFFCIHNMYTLHIWTHFDENREQSSFVFRLVTEGKTSSFSVSDEEPEYLQMKNLFESVMANANDISVELNNFFKP